MPPSNTAGRSSARGHRQPQEEQRPAKRRRVEEEHKADKGGARPPVKISVTQPHGALRRTVNGVRTEIAVARHGVDARGHLLPESQQDAATADATSSSADQKRVLRSQGGGQRLSSDLEHFFPDYEESIFGEPKPPDILNADSTLYVTDDKGNSTTLPIRTASSPKSKKKSHPQPQLADNESPSLPDPTSPKIATTLPSNVELLDLSAYETEALDFHADPLSDSWYLKAHRRGERNEKQMRNVEKERATHEKWELERLYDELRGPDWLRTMGISGITETEKKTFEPKRDHYIGRVKALLAKFEHWKEAEKELRLKKERAMATKAEADEGDEAEEEGDEQDVKEEDEDGNHRGEEEEYSDADRDGSSSILDAAALQLQLEAESANQSLSKPKPKPKPKAAVYDPALEHWESAKPFTSFYSKPHERAAALGTHRRGRHITAFGHPLPEMPEQEFELPEGFLTGEEMRDNARKRRREKRDSHATEKEK